MKELDPLFEALPGICSTEKVQITKEDAKVITYQIFRELGNIKAFEAMEFVMHYISGHRDKKADDMLNLIEGRKALKDLADGEKKLKLLCPKLFILISRVSSDKMPNLVHLLFQFGDGKFEP